jgi:hypothetical protein
MDSLAWALRRKADGVRRYEASNTNLRSIR